MNTLDSMIISAQLKMARAKESFKEFWTSEKGVSNVVATIILLLIVVLIIGVFWNRLKEWLNTMMDSIFNNTEPKAAGEKKL